MSQRLLLLDLDRTLLDTDRFMPALWRAIAGEYHLDFGTQMAEVPRWYRAIGEYRYYDLQLHLSEGLGLDPDAVLKTVTPILKKEDFLYPDAAELAAWQQHGDYEIRILTFGPRWVQAYKISLLPVLHALPTDMTLEPKTDFIARQFAGRTGILVDDKRNPGLPEGFTEVWLNRGDSVQNHKYHGIITINSLTQVQEVL